MPLIQANASAKDKTNTFSNKFGFNMMVHSETKQPFTLTFYLNNHLVHGMTPYTDFHEYNLHAMMQQKFWGVIQITHIHISLRMKTILTKYIVPIFWIAQLLHSCKIGLFKNKPKKVKLSKWFLTSVSKKSGQTTVVSDTVL